MNSVDTSTLPSDEIDTLEGDATASAALIKKLTIAGHTVHADKSGGYTVARWAISRHCMDFESLREFAKQVGAD